ncbi:hypothetical protein D6779_08865 [Candidatus Parcubacteria bacterium]|nr:MAG: hypothetical protein D6779_08865 [Candidatus Parcubacteria bacterium]
MKSKFSWSKMARMVSIMGFISAPAMALSGYAVYTLRNWLEVSLNFYIPDPIYLLILFFAVWVAMWATAGKLIAEIRNEGLRRK